MEEEHLFPPKPEEPLPSDCCGTGCVPCVLDIYDKELKLWERQCDQMRRQNAGIDLSESQQGSEVISTDRYKSYEIIRILEESADIKSFRFALGNYEKLPLKVGQHLIMRWSKGDGAITRQYTPVSDCTEPGYFDVTIKIYSDGRMSSHVQTWVIGSKIEWRGPYGDFQYVPNKHEKLVLLAAGTGIAPMVQVIRHILRNEDDETMVHLMYSVKEYGDLMCRDLLDNWKEFWNFEVTYFVTQGTNKDVQAKYGDKLMFGRIDGNAVKERLPSSHKGTYFCICGTKSFDKDMIKLLKALDFTDNSYHKF